MKTALRYLLITAAGLSSLSLPRVMSAQSPAEGIREAAPAQNATVQLALVDQSVLPQSTFMVIRRAPGRGWTDLILLRDDATEGDLARAEIILVNSRARLGDTISGQIRVTSSANDSIPPGTPVNDLRRELQHLRESPLILVDNIGNARSMVMRLHAHAARR